MKKVLAIAGLVLALLLGWIAAGPFLAVAAIRDAIRNEDARALARHVDFPAVRESLGQQLRGILLRKAGLDEPSGLLGTVVAGVAGSASDTMVELLATPAGLGALMEGYKFRNRLAGLPPPVREGAATHPDPLQDARYRFESLSRFTATIHHGDGSSTVLMLSRRGLHWKLSDIRLPL